MMTQLRSYGAAILLLLCFTLLFAAYFAPAHASADRSESGDVDWLEPTGINIVDLVGFISEDLLVDLIIAYRPGTGIVQYVEGERIGDTVIIKVAYHYSDKNEVSCLGRTGHLDNWASITPAGVVRFFDGEQDITDRIQPVYSYFPAGRRQPVRGSRSHNRYNEIVATITRDANGAIVLPANRGCLMRIAGGEPTSVTAVFTFEDNPSYISITPVHSDRVTMRSFIGAGEAGILESLSEQMLDRYGDQLPPFGRHDGWQWYPQPASVKNKLANEANYVLVKFPPMPIDEFAGSAGLDTQSGGTYRLFFSDGGTFSHSVDHQMAQLLPLHWNFQDADQAPTSIYLPTFFTFNQVTGFRFDEIKGPEYYLPPGVDYHPCMSNGGCSDAILDEVFNATYPMDVAFYKVERTRGGLDQIPIRMPGPNYSAGSSQRNVVSTADMHYQIYVPAVYSPPQPPAPDDPSDCIPYGCGWFDDIGRMWSVVTP